MPLEREFSPCFLIRRVTVILFALILIFLPLTGTAQCEAMGIDDLLNPEFPYDDDKVVDNLPLVQGSNKEGNIDQLLGPKDIFPFLPDNHRDSGTGKFNSF